MAIEVEEIQRRRPIRTLLMLHTFGDFRCFIRTLCGGTSPCQQSWHWKKLRRKVDNKKVHLHGNRKCPHNRPRKVLSFKEVLRKPNFKIFSKKCKFVALFKFYHGSILKLCKECDFLKVKQLKKNICMIIFLLL